MVLLVLVTTVVGILIFFSASLALLPKGGSSFSGALLSQLVLGLGGGLVSAYVLLHVPVTLFKRFAPHLFIFSLLMTAAVFIPIIGVTANGATRWIDVGFTTFQPSELLKVSYVLFLAAILSRGKDRGADLVGGVLPYVLISALSALILLLQPDTDTLIVIVFAGAAMLFASGLKLRDLAIGGVAVLLGLILLIVFRPYLMERIETFLDPTRDPLGSGYQIQQSLIAVGSGGLWGRGYGQSIQKFSYLPEASSDSVFAVYAEEFGFLGSVLLIFLILCFVLRGLWISARAHELFGGLVALGLVTLIGVQSFMNIAAMIHLVPVGGLPLPFISHGGTALFITLSMAGIILAVSKTVRS